MGQNSFVRVPPDSTGKRLFSQEHVVGADTVQAQVFHQADPDNPLNLQAIDNRGQASVRFAEGSPTLDAFGNLRISNAQILGGYEYSCDSMADLFQDKTEGAGDIEWISNSAMTRMQVDGAAASLATRSTNRWHYYQPGVGNLAIFTLYLNDNGKANNTRRWGYFGIRNGQFFELQGTTLNVVSRSWIGGSTNEMRIPRDQWNGDQLDGTGLSGLNIDLTKANLFWIDIAWLGVGAVRFGIVAPDGQRFVCHTFENPNANTGAYMGRGSLPVRFENFNTGVTAGASDLNLICAAVYAEARTDYTYWRYSDAERATPLTVTTNTPVLSMRPKILAANNLPNRVGIYPETLSVFISGGSVKLDIVDDAVLTGETWVEGQGLVEYDISATAATGGVKFKTFYLPAGAHNIDLTPFYETNDEGYHVNADWTDAHRFTLLATKFDGATVQVAATLNHRELA
jgi:hypothetical protein